MHEIFSERSTECLEYGDNYSVSITYMHYFSLKDKTFCILQKEIISYDQWLIIKLWELLKK